VPLTSIAVIIALIGATSTKTGLAVKCVIDNAIYEKGLKVCDVEFDSINIIRDVFHGEWNQCPQVKQKSQQLTLRL
jgi:hypothetical protein